ncbi:hypothetical protein V8E36_001102 [Tilletia maclaganii]
MKNGHPTPHLWLRQDPSFFEVPHILSRLGAKGAHVSLFMRSSADSGLSVRWQTSVSSPPPLLLSELREVLKWATADVVLAKG